MAAYAHTAGQPINVVHTRSTRSLLEIQPYVGKRQRPIIATAVDKHLSSDLLLGACIEEYDQPLFLDFVASDGEDAIASRTGKQCVSSVQADGSPVVEAADSAVGGY